jgi:hypothetical protein
MELIVLMAVALAMQATKKVYPSLASPVTITGSATANTYGSWTEVMPASATSSSEKNYFRIQSLTVEDNSTSSDFYQLELSTGASGSEVSIGTFRFGGKFFGQIPVFCYPFEKGTRISARVSTVSGSTHTTKISISYSEE